MASISAALTSTAAPLTVYFPSADGRTELVGYLFEPAAPGRHPAVVMLHGRGGPYSSNVNGECGLVARDRVSRCTAATLSRRHRMWGEYWAQLGYVALHVDSFGPRGRAHGYGRGTHDDPEREAVNERTVRPLDAQGALTWLAQRGDVRADRVMLQGWSNGASAVLNTLLAASPASGSAGTPNATTAPAPRFRAALAFYPGCGPRALLGPRYRAAADLWVFLASDDEEVSPAVCERVLQTADAGAVGITTYAGATHDFDDPGPQRQAVPANRAASADAMQRSAAWLESLP